MPVLILDNLTPTAPPHGMILDSRITIGRRPFNTVMIPDPGVSRIHAWIGRREGQEHYILYDAGSRSGTFLNGQPAREPRTLHDGDIIRIGQATLTYMEADQLPADVATFDPAHAPPAYDPYDGGIYFDCSCGGPMWVTADLAGASGRCRYCGQRLLVPHTSGSVARPIIPGGAEDGAAVAPAPRARAKAIAPPPKPQKPAKTVKSATPAQAPAVVVEESSGQGAPGSGTSDIAAGPIAGEFTANEGAAPMQAEVPTLHAPIPEPSGPAADLHTCSICQTTIVRGEEHTSCPSCHLTFHTQCWQENFGCSAYGCDQVNVLAPERRAGHAMPAAADAGADRSEAEAVDHAILPPARGFPWETLLLALSFVAMGLGALAFGIPSAIMLLWTLAFLLMKKPTRRGLIILAALVGLAGALAGWGTSMLWWKGVRVWETLLK